MTKDALGPLVRAVPRSISSAGTGAASPRGGRRPVDRRIGKRGAAVLAGVPLFSGLSKRQIKQLAESADEVSFYPGERIVEAGMRGGTMFVILQGEARVVRGKRTLGRLRPGEFFGEVSLLDDGPRTATVIAGTPVVAVRLYRRSLRKLIESEPEVAVRILRVVASRFRSEERPLTG